MAKESKKALVKVRVTYQTKDRFYSAVGDMSKAMTLFIEAVIEKDKSLIKDFF